MTGVREVPRVRVGVQVVLRRGDDYLLVLRARGYGAGLWGFPGGNLEIGETLLECAARELREETGLTARAFRLVAVTDPNPSANHHMQIAMETSSWTGTPHVVDPTECAEVRFRQRSDIDDALFPPTREILTRLDEGFIYPPPTTG